MLWMILLLLIPSALAQPQIQSFEEIGIDTFITHVEQNRTWEFDYEFEGNCTPFIAIFLERGQAYVYNNGREIIYAKGPGTYRAVIDRAGRISITLLRNEDEEYARILAKSFIACDRMPVIRVIQSHPEPFHVGGYDEWAFYISNDGSAPARVIPLLRLPEEVAPLEPVDGMEVGPGAKMMAVEVTTARESREKLIWPQCFEYTDAYGRWTACTDESIMHTVTAPKILCIETDEGMELFNAGTVPVEINAEKILPRDSKTIPLRDAERLQMCDIVLKTEKMPFRKIEDHSIDISVILTISGLVAFGVSGKGLKTRKT